MVRSYGNACHLGWWSAMVDKKLLDILVCPWCLGELDLSEDKLTCKGCHSVYAVQDDIPNMLVQEAHLFCPKCKKELEKEEEYAFCASCQLMFSLIDRIEGDMLSHAKPYRQDGKAQGPKA